MTGTPEDPHAVSRSPVELARHLLHVILVPGFYTPQPAEVQALARAVRDAERHCEKADAALDRVTRSMGSSRGPDVLEAQVEVFAALSVLRGSDTA